MPHHDLAKLQAQVKQFGASCFTKAAIDGGALMNLTTSEMLAVVAGLGHEMFYKSMTSYHSQKTWQDVYHSNVPSNKIAYIKLIDQDGKPVIQFKEK